MAETPPNKPEASQVPKQLHKFVTEDGELELTDEQLKVAVNKGYQKAKEEAAAKEKKPAEEKKEPDVTERLTTLEKRLLAKEINDDNSKLVDRVDALGKLAVDAGLGPQFKEDLEEKIITRVAILKQQGKSVDLEDIAKKETDKFISKFPPKVDLEEKAKDKKLTQSTVPGTKPTGEKAPATLGRRSFRDGTLAKAVAAGYKSAVKAITE